ncbi:MFS transporter [Micromonospora sp. BQ11]|uniref:MFS transporter n=1 Tax=Micromonospora sp. BQ11 TaxID=3452212 RepID=UPI003F8AA1DB
MRGAQQPVRGVDAPAEPGPGLDPRRWKALAVVALAQFMLILDVTVINVALPDMGADLGLSRLSFTWAVSIYGLVFGGLLLLGGRLADMIGTRPIIMTGLLIFTLASLTSGAAQNEAMLLAGRIGQGAGAALLSPAALAAVTSLFHGNERNKALSIWASLGGLGFTAGVLIGGLLTAGPGWRWVFFINIPVGIALLLAVRALVPLRRNPHPDRLDIWGALTVTTASAALIYGLINAGDKGWTHPTTWAPITTAILLYTAFIAIERTTTTPLMRLNLLTRRPVAAGAFLMLTAAGILIADLFLTSQYLQHLRELNPLRTGLFFLPPALALMTGAILAGRLIGRTGTRPIATTALLLVAAGNALLTDVSTTGNIYTQALPGTTLFALGGGPLFVCATTTALGRIDLREAGLVSGIINTFNQLGAALCVAIASTIAATSLTTNPTTQGLTNAFTTFTIIAITAALTAALLTPPGKPHTTDDEAVAP